MIKFNQTLVLNIIFKHPCQYFSGSKATGSVSKLSWLTVWQNNIFSSTCLQKLWERGSIPSMKLVCKPSKIGNNSVRILLTVRLGHHLAYNIKQATAILDLHALFWRSRMLAALLYIVAYSSLSAALPAAIWLSSQQDNLCMLPPVHAVFVDSLGKCVATC